MVFFMSHYTISDLLEIIFFKKHVQFSDGIQINVVIYLRTPESGDKTIIISFHTVYFSILVPIYPFSQGLFSCKLEPIPMGPRTQRM